MQITFQSPAYEWANVTGRYVRVEGSKRKGYLFRVSETENGKHGAGIPGKIGGGPTIREYLTDGAGLPEELKARCMATKNTTKWDNPNT